MTGFTDPVDAVKAVLGMPRDLDYPELVHPEPRADEPPVYDHKAEAERFIEESVDYADPRNRPSAGLQMAQVHATLALVDAQNTANLIAWVGVTEVITPAIRERIGKELGI